LTKIPALNEAELVDSPKTAEEEEMSLVGVIVFVVVGVFVGVIVGVGVGVFVGVGVGVEVGAVVEVPVGVSVATITSSWVGVGSEIFKVSEFESPAGELEPPV